MNQTIITATIMPIAVARIVMSVRPRTMVDRMEETIRSLASVSIASMIAPTVSQMLMEWMPL